MLRFDQTTYMSIIVEGKDGNPGCEKLKGTIPWIIKADYKSGADTMTFDFSPKGGPSAVVGKWDKDGILFPDGNKWTRVFKSSPPAATLGDVDPEALRRKGSSLSGSRKAGPWTSGTNAASRRDA